MNPLDYLKGLSKIHQPSPASEFKVAQPENPLVPKNQIATSSMPVKFEVTPHVQKFQRVKGLMAPKPKQFKMGKV